MGSDARSGAHVGLRYLARRWTRGERRRVRPAIFDARGTARAVRLINIQPADPVTFEVLRDSALVQWRAVAKDGYDLPRAQATVERAQRSLWVGETFDAEFAPRAPGTYRLRVRSGPKDVLYERELVVHVR